jgi:SPP1 gp7 family putative phage head morphogenesis protein
MLLDSTFTPLLYQSEEDVPFADDEPLIPATQIIGAMEGTSNTASNSLVLELTDATKRLLQRAEPLLEAEDTQGILALDWGLNLRLQPSLNELWRQGWRDGEQQGVQSMLAAVPAQAVVEAVGTQTNAVSTYRLSQRILQAIRALLGIQRNPAPDQDFGGLPAAARSIQRRNIRLAGDFSQDQLNRLKSDLVASILPQPDTGDPISRPELLRRIEKTLNVGRSRAKNIARTETTSAYNHGRLASFRKSSLVTHVRFLAITDDRTTDICRSRNGMLIPIDDARAIAANSPPLHYFCRSVLSNVMPAVNPEHQKMVDDPKRDPNNRQLVPLLEGWVSG